METLRVLIDLVLHLNKHLAELVADHGSLVYGILFVIVFCETGLVVTPFLPGDSLLFAAGAIAATSSELNVLVLSGTLLVAAILGDTVNYWVGKLAGTVLTQRFPRLIREEHIERTHKFYLRYGGKAIIIARFVPIVRTFAPFVAGIGKMNYGRFMTYNVVGAFLWVFLLVPAGYFFANVPIVKERFSLVILMIIILSVLPAVFEAAKEWRRARNSVNQN